MKTVLDELTARLAGRGLAVSELRVTLTFEGGCSRSEELLLPRPLRTTAPLLATLQERLFAHHDGDKRERDAGARDWPARLTSLSVQALRAVPAPKAQLSFFSREETDAEELATLLARLTSSLGRDRVFAAELVPTHRPEAAWRRTDFAGLLPVSSSSDASKSRAAPSTPKSSRATKAKKIHDHDVTEPPSGRPLLVLPEPRRMTGELTTNASLEWDGGHGVVQGIWGPERLRGQWWSTPFDRDYYVVDLDRGARLWIYWDRRDEALYLQGIFD